MTNIEKRIDDIAENQGGWYERQKDRCNTCIFKPMGCLGAEQERESENYYTHRDCERVFKKWAREEAGQ